MLYRKLNPHVDRPRWVSEDRGLFPVQGCWRWSKSQVCVATMTKRPKSSGTSLEPVSCCTRGLASASATFGKGCHTYRDAVSVLLLAPCPAPAPLCKKAKVLTPPCWNLLAAFAPLPGKPGAPQRAPARVRVGEGTDPVLREPRVQQQGGRQSLTTARGCRGEN